MRTRIIGKVILSAFLSAASLCGEESPVSTLSVNTIPVKPCKDIIFNPTKKNTEFRVLIANPAEDVLSSTVPGAFIRVLDGDDVYHAGVITHVSFTKDDKLEICYINEGLR